MSTRVFSSVGLLLVAANLFALRGTAAESPTAAGEIGLKIGDPAPGFTLKDQNGLEVSLSDLVKKGPVAVVFHRSAEWCLFCKFELRHLQRNLRKFEAEGGQVVAISYDSSDILKKFADRQSITFPLLSDQGSKTIDAFKVLDRSATDPTNRFSAHVAFVLDQGGIVRDKLVDVILREEPGIGYLVKAVREARNAKPEGRPPVKQETSSRDPQEPPPTRNPT